MCYSYVDFLMHGHKVTCYSLRVFLRYTSVEHINASYLIELIHSLDRCSSGREAGTTGNSVRY